MAPPSRRKVLRSIGASGIAMTGLSSSVGSVSASDKSLENITVESLDGKDRKEVLKKVKKDKVVKSLLEKVKKEESYKPKYKEGRVKETRQKETEQKESDNETSSWYSTVIPFKQVGNSEEKEVEVYLLWCTSDKRDTAIYDYDESDESTTVYKKASADEETKKSNEITKSVVEWENPNGSPVGIQSECEECECEPYVCDEYNWSCILDIVGSVGVGVFSCAACGADPTKITCGLCLSAVANAAGSFGCSPGEGCEYQTQCRPASACQRGSVVCEYA